MSLFRPIFATLLACLLVFTLSRIGIVGWQYDRLAQLDSPHLLFIFAQGLRFDVLTVAVLLGIPAFLAPIFALNPRTGAIYLKVLKVYCLVVIALVVFMEMATPSFINEYDVKPDRRFIEYLIYPQEVFGMLWSAYKLQLAMAAVMVGVAVYGLKGVLQRFSTTPSTLSVWRAIALLPLIVLVVLAAIRSTTDHRPVNPSTVVFAPDPLANQFALNSTYTTLYAIYELRHEETKFAYKKVPWEQAVAAVRADMRIPEELFSADSGTTQHKQLATRPRKQPLNLVIVLEESLGADYVGALGGLPITPELDQLRDSGLWFDNLYATGTRSVRGIEAVVAGFPPTTARSVVKLPGAQTGFFTLARLLSSAGYSTSFIYGGEPQFDNMGRFFANNGFQTIIGRHDFKGDVFDGDWGASDGDLFRKADQIFRDQPDGKPFFSLVFSSSNHSPFDYPPGKIEPYNSPAETVENAVKYADYALGQFIKDARNSPYWENTVFLVIADHSDRVYGDVPVPIKLFHIPAVFVGGSIQPERIERIASQIDMLPTMLSLIGLDSEHPAIGIDQTRTDLGDYPGRAIMQYNRNQAYMEGDRVAILLGQGGSDMYTYRDETLIPAEPDANFLDHAAGIANWTWQAYKRKAYSGQ